jgi:lysozyme family protein
MPSPAFLGALPFVLRWEGGFIDHPDDPGGRTNRGVTQKVYDAWRAEHDHAPRDVKLIDDEEVHVIYEQGYWLPPRCDALQRRLDLVHFDTAVNMGVRRAVQMLQGVAGCKADGAFGPNTERALAGCDAEHLTAAYCDARENYYRRLVEVRPKLGQFLKGWLNRLNALRREVDPAGLESRTPVDFGAAGYIRRIPDLGVDPTYDLQDV